jgi:flagellar hook protein FlgE
VTFTKNFAGAPGQWDFEVTTADATIAGITGGTGSIVFDETGVITSGDFADVDIDYAPETGVTTPQTVTLDFGTADNGAPMTSVAGASDVTLAEQDGLAAGALQTFAIGADGTITGFYSNGTTQALGVVQIATFNNPSGLLRVGQNHYEQSFSSGEPSVGNPGVGGRGILAPGALEASNVDLAKEFTAMILAQTGFQANARSIQTQDELLRELVNLTR